MTMKSRVKRYRFLDTHPRKATHCVTRERAMLIGTASEAVVQGRCLEVRYDGYVRVVEVHACGYTREGHSIMRVWQVRGGAASVASGGGGSSYASTRRGALSVLAEASQAPRRCYRRGDSAMSRIVAHV